MLSCNYGKYGALEPVESKLEEEKVKVFSSSFQKVLYKASLEAFSKNMGGLLFIKKDTNSNYRMVFTTEMGLTLFDMEYVDTGYVVHKSLPQLEKYGILDLIKEDMSILLQTNVSLQTAGYYESKHANGPIAKFTIDSKRSQFYYFDSKQEFIEKIEKSRGARKRIEMTLSKQVDGAPADIYIKHHGKNLKMELNKMAQ